MNCADLRFFEPPERAVEPVALVGGRFSSCLFEGLTQAELQLAGGLFREGDGNDPGNFGTAGFDDAHDPPHQLGGFAGAGGGFDYQCVVEHRRNLLSIGLISKRRCHGWPLS